MPDDERQDDRLKDPAELEQAKATLKQKQPLWGYKGVPFDAETQEYLNAIEARDWARRRGH